MAEESSLYSDATRSTAIVDPASAASVWSDGTKSTSFKGADEQLLAVAEQKPKVSAEEQNRKRELRLQASWKAGIELVREALAIERSERLARQAKESVGSKDSDQKLPTVADPDLPIRSLTGLNEALFWVKQGKVEWVAFLTEEQEAQAKALELEWKNRRQAGEKVKVFPHEGSYEQRYLKAMNSKRVPKPEEFAEVIAPGTLAAIARSQQQMSLNLTSEASV